MSPTIQKPQKTINKNAITKGLKSTVGTSFTNTDAVLMTAMANLILEYMHNMNMKLSPAIPQTP